MELLPLLHICAATVGLLSGYLAMLLRKGTSVHRVTGSIFVVSMLTMSASAAYLAAFVSPNRLNVVAALLTFYLVATAWWTARRRDGGRSSLDLAGLLLVTAVAVMGLTFGREARFFGIVASLFVISDVRMLVRGGVSGPRRIARHLWRMCLALLIATLSLYPGQAKLFSQPVRETGLLFVPHVFLVAAMIFWMVRVRKRRTAPRTEGSQMHVSPLPVTAGTLAE